MSTRNSTAQMVGNMWVRYDKLRNKAKQKWAEVNSYVYADSTRDTDNGANFSNSTHRPKIAQIYDLLTANYSAGLMPHKNWLRIESEDKKSRDNIKTNKAIMAYLLTKHRISRFGRVVDLLIEDWVMYGNCFSMVYYQTEKTNADNSNNQLGSNYTGPKVRRISPYDIVFNPIASDWERTPKIIRSLMSMGELVRRAEDNPDEGYLLDGITELQNNRSLFAGLAAEDINKAVSLKIDGFGSYSEYAQSDNIEILELYGDFWDAENKVLLRDYVITVADRGIVLRKMPLETWTGRPHLHHSGWRNRKDNLWAMGPLENLCGLQYRINHLENAQSDAFDEMLYGDLVISGTVDIEVNQDGSKTYTIPEGGSVGRLAPDTTVLSADLKIRELEAMMHIYAGAPPEAGGIRTPGEKTKFEVSQIMSTIGRIFQHKMTKFEVEMLETSINSEIQVGRQHMVANEIVRYDSQGLQEFLTINKDDLMINGSVVPIGARHFSRQSMLSSDLRDFQSQVLAGDKELAQHFPTLKLAEIWEDILGFDEYDMMEPYGRIPEQMAAQRLVNAATKTVATEDAFNDDEIPS